jgi:hypothetical protein
MVPESRTTGSYRFVGGISTDKRAYGHRTINVYGWPERASGTYYKWSIAAAKQFTQVPDDSLPLVPRNT